MIVLDASAALEFLLNTEVGSEVGMRLADPNETVHAPHLLDLEVAQVLRRFVMAETLAASRAATALEDLQALGVERYAHDILLARIWDLRHNFTAYDAAYIALAESLPAPLLTTDAHLGRAPGHGATIEVIA